MLAAMPQRVYREWMLYAETDPWDEQRADWRAAMIAQTMASLWRGKRGRRTKLKDFLPQFKRAAQPRTPKQGLNAMKNLALAFGGSIQDNRPEWKKKRDGPL
jgi:hypothetical protein